MKLLLAAFVLGAAAGVALGIGALAILAAVDWTRENRLPPRPRVLPNVEPKAEDWGGWSA